MDSPAMVVEAVAAWHPKWKRRGERELDPEGFAQACVKAEREKIFREIEALPVTRDGLSLSWECEDVQRVLTGGVPKRKDAHRG